MAAISRRVLLAEGCRRSGSHSRFHHWAVRALICLCRNCWAEVRGRERRVWTADSAARLADGVVALVFLGGFQVSVPRGSEHLAD